ncbi:ABC transporter substrate-binding protein [Zoogloea sp.]|uniref:ABC transporter substrate-binding protein n=1 Tax=Zoogloea sp. TaxID=49181 RepID=UPI0035B00BD4
MNPIRRALIVTLLAIAACSVTPVARAASVVLVLSEDSSAFNEAAEALTAELRSAGHRAQTLVVPLRADDAAALNNTGLVVSFGTRAAQTVANLAPRSLVLHTLLPRSAYERLPNRGDDTRRVSAVFIDQPTSRQLELLRIALPDWTRVGIVVGRESAELGSRLQSGARDKRLRPVVEYAGEESDLYPALQRLLAEPTVLLAVPDAQLFNNRTISNILLTAYHHRSPVIGFSPAYVKAGALFALYSTPAQIGQQAGEAARVGLATGSLPPPTAPRQFRISTNTYVARSMGITLEDANVLRERLERAENPP